MTEEQKIKQLPSIWGYVNWSELRSVEHAALGLKMRGKLSNA